MCEYNKSCNNSKFKNTKTKYVRNNSSWINIFWNNTSIFITVWNRCRPNWKCNLFFSLQIKRFSKKHLINNTFLFCCGKFSFKIEFNFLLKLTFIFSDWHIVSAHLEFRFILPILLLCILWIHTNNSVSISYIFTVIMFSIIWLVVKLSFFW